MAYIPKGVFTTPKDFKHDYYWKQLGQFRNFLETKVSEWRWAEILGSLEAHAIANEKVVTDEDNNGDDVPNLSVLLAYRAGIYIPESPTKA